MVVVSAAYCIGRLRAAGLSGSGWLAAGLVGCIAVAAFITILHL